LDGMTLLKKCSKCGLEKELGGFKLDKRRRLDGRASWCKGCHNNAAREARIKYPEKVREYWRNYRRNKPATERKLYARTYNLKNLFGLSFDDYCNMHTAQSGVCAICKGPETVIDSRTGQLYTLCVDHDHRTSRVRQLLCRRCNLAVGQVDISADYAYAVYDYIRQWSLFDNIV
jgi:hypothetical protein